MPKDQLLRYSDACVYRLPLLSRNDTAAALRVALAEPPYGIGLEEARVRIHALKHSVYLGSVD
jgi:hypothetical protein